MPRGDPKPALDQLATQAHLWWVAPDDISDPGLLDTYRGWLSQEERARHERFRFARDRHLFLVSHALVRWVLSHYAECDPVRWAFEIGDFGRPEIVGGPAGLRFNLSHTRGLAACAVTRTIDCGVDVERQDRRIDIPRLAERVLSSLERDALLALPKEEQPRRFCQLWTLKESYIKARGLGLRLSLRSFAFDFGEDERVAISFERPIEDEPADWQFGSDPIPGGFRIAVALRRGRRPDLRVVHRSTVPGVGEP